MLSEKNMSSSASFYLKLIVDKKLDPKRLTPHVRRLCTRYLLQGRKHTQRQIAEILHVDEHTIGNYKRKMLSQDVWILDEIDERKIAVHFIQTAEEASAKLFRDGKVKDAVQVERDCIEVLQGLGCIKRKPVEIEMDLTLTEVLKLASDETFEPLEGQEGSGPSGT